MTTRLAIVILQYGKWRDTVACLQSLVPAVLSGVARVIVVDNASPDDSAAALERWISGALASLPAPVGDSLAAHCWPLTGAPGCAWDAVSTAGAATAGLFTLVRAASNRGFATGMNHGLRVALGDEQVDAVWLLNNDTVADPGAVAAIRDALDEHAPNVGQFGTTVCYYDRPTVIQSVGWCRWNPWLATAQRMHDGAPFPTVVSEPIRQPGYVYGASWVLRASALRGIGLLSEEGFLYGEELDWSCRAASAWNTGLISKAVVWHREGATIGAQAATPSARTRLTDLCAISARLRVSRRFFPRHLPTVYSSLFGAALHRLVRGDAGRAVAVARLVLAGGLPAPWPEPTGISLSTTPS